MTYIKNNKTLVVIIAILFLSNIALLYFFIKKCDKDDVKPPQKSFREMMVQTLRDSVGFNDQQVTQYEQLSNNHKEAMKPMFEALRQTKDTLYSQLQLPSISDSIVNHYLDKVGEKQRNIDQKIFNHFRSLREISTPEQRPKYDTLIQRTVKRMIGKR